MARSTLIQEGYSWTTSGFILIDVQHGLSSADAHVEELVRTDKIAKPFHRHFIMAATDNTPT
jgi:hypothetical protein|tara:strand:+ start:58 stop:243 length:186 start_codon:yes stop_codon:yes gene_type:complete